MAADAEEKSRGTFRDRSRRDHPTEAVFAGILFPGGADQAVVELPPPRSGVIAGKGDAPRRFRRGPGGHSGLPEVAGAVLDAQHAAEEELPAALVAHDERGRLLPLRQQEIQPVSGLQRDGRRFAGAPAGEGIEQDHGAGTRPGAAVDSDAVKAERPVDFPVSIAAPDSGGGAFGNTVVQLSFPGKSAGDIVDELEELPAGIPQPENDPAQFDWFRELDPKGEGRLFEPADFGGGGRDEPQFHRDRDGIAPADGRSIPAGAGQRGPFDFHLIQAGNFSPLQPEFCIAELQKFSGRKRRKEKIEKKRQKEFAHIFSLSLSLYRNFCVSFTAVSGHRRPER